MIRFLNKLFNYKSEREQKLEDFFYDIRRALTDLYSIERFAVSEKEQITKDNFSRKYGIPPHDAMEEVFELLVGYINNDYRKIKDLQLSIISNDFKLRPDLAVNIILPRLVTYSSISKKDIKNID